MKRDITSPIINCYGDNMKERRTKNQELQIQTGKSYPRKKDVNASEDL